MSVETLVELIKVLEADETVPYTDYLTDGDEDEFPPSLKAVAEYFDENFVSREDARELEKAGYRIIYGDCIGIHTKKGALNTGSDNL